MIRPSLLPPSILARMASGAIICLTVLLLSGWLELRANSVEHRVPATAKTKITVLNFAQVVVTGWDQDEVALKATAPNAQVTDQELTIAPGKDKLEITCRPAQPDKAITLTLNLPRKANLTVSHQGHKIEVQSPADEITVTMARDQLDLKVPDQVALDLTGVPTATKFSYPAPNVMAGQPVGARRSGIGPPFVKVAPTDARVMINWAGWLDRDRPVTYAARTIATKDDLLGRAIRRTEPRLVKPNKASATAESPAEAEEDEVKLKAQLVNLNLSVTDRDGKAIPGLKPSDFQVYEDGVQQQISYFATDAAPFNLILLLDMSGSVSTKAELIKEAALHFLDSISSQDSVAVFTFAEDVKVVSHLTKDRAMLRERISEVAIPTGGTAFYDALGYVLAAELSKVRGQRNAVVVLTDGQDNSIFAKLRQSPQPQNPFPINPRAGSLLTFEDLLAGVIEADALIYPIHLKHTAKDVTVVQSGGSGGVPGAMLRVSPINDEELLTIARRQLLDLAEASGGRLYHAEVIEDLKDVYRQVAAELRTIYSLAYSPTNETADDKFRRIQVQVKHSAAAVRTRRGYTPR